MFLLIELKNSNKEMITRNLQYLTLTALVLLLQTFHTEGHFTMMNPVSREKLKWPSDNTRFFPIKGGSTLRPGGDCTKLQVGQKTSLNPGPYSIQFEIGNGASHKGPCKASLLDAKTGQKVEIGQMNDCLPNGAKLDVTIPANFPCTECVLMAEVTATHMGSEAQYEYYDSCADVTIGGNSAGSLRSPSYPSGGAAISNSSPQPVSSVPQSAPQSVPAPSTDSNYAQQQAEYQRQLAEYNRQMAIYQQQQALLAQNQPQMPPRQIQSPPMAIQQSQPQPIVVQQQRIVQ